MSEMIKRADTAHGQASAPMEPAVTAVRAIEQEPLSDREVAGEARESAAPGRKRVLFACVTDSAHQYQSQALRLVQSLRWFGGTMADAPFLVAVDGVMPDYLPQFEALGARMQTIPRFDAVRAHLPHHG